VRWDELFADIESQLEQELDAERLDLAAEEERLRLGRLTLRDRLEAMAHAHDTVALMLADGESVEARIDSTGRDWIAGESRVGGGVRALVVPTSAVIAVLPTGDQLERGLRAPGSAPVSDLAARLGLAFVLRDLCRRRIVVDLRTVVGTHHGTIDRVGRDHLDLAEHELGEPRRQRVVRRVRVVPFAAILSVHA
jgi:hypothetical protein